MAGQNQQLKYDREYLFNEHNKTLINQVDLWYIKDKFNIGNDFDENKAIMSYLFRDIYQTSNCELIKFTNKKLRGALGDENIKVVNLLEMYTEHRDINNYFYTAQHWETTQW